MGDSGDCGRFSLWRWCRPGWGLKPLKWAIPALLVGGCVIPQPDCRTACGMAVFGDSECQRLNDFEAVGVGAFGYLYEPLCDRLGTVSLFVRNAPDGKWVDEYGRTVAGLTWCDMGTVEVADSKYQTNAYFHELAHVAQCPEQDGSHSGWQELGIWAHLEALKASPVGFEKQGPDYIGDGDAP